MSLRMDLVSGAYVGWISDVPRIVLRMIFWLNVISDDNEHWKGLDSELTH